MCEPVSIGLAVSSAIGSLAGVEGQRQQGKAQRAALTRQAKVRGEEIQEQNEERIGTRIREARRERARARVAAAEGGVGGQSFALQIKDSLFQQDLDVAANAKNLGIQGRGLNAGLQSSFASTANPGALDFITAGISGATSGLQIGQSLPGYEDRKNRPSKTK